MNEILIEKSFSTSCASEREKEGPLKKFIFSAFSISKLNLNTRGIVPLRSMRVSSLFYWSETRAHFPSDAEVSTPLKKLS